MAKIVTNRYIVAIGVSAYSLEAITSFFDQTSFGNVSYILISHLSPFFKTQLSQIIARHTKLKIVEAADQMRIEPNKVYFISSNNFMVIKGGMLLLSDKKHQQTSNMIIDHFFTSLAKDQGEKAIGVILSGTGKDGLNGVEAIKRSGGLVIVQDPKTANLKEMPLSAIAVESADIILSPKAMPKFIRDYVSNDLQEELSIQEHPEISENEPASIISLIMPADIDNIDVVDVPIAFLHKKKQSPYQLLQLENDVIQSANNELQFVNNELQILNQEQQVYNTELVGLNDELNSYFSSNVNGLLFVSLDLKLKKYSPAAVQYLNLHHSNIGRPLATITTNLKFETLTEDIKQVILDKKTITREAELLNGKIYQVVTMPYFKNNGTEIDGAIISFYEITELKTILDGLAISNKSLDISNKSLDTSNKSLLRINADLNNFVYSASHDLNSPILNIEALVAMLIEKMDLKDPEVATLSEVLNKAVFNFKSVISDLSKIGQVEAEMLAESPMEDFADIFNEVIELISEKIKLTQVTFNIEFKERGIKFPKKNLRSILLNLITNAIKFSVPGKVPQITIKTEKADSFVLLTVKDNGVGINEKQIASIFSMYKRINEGIEGQGIGLYLVKKIIDATGGKVEVESELGTGSTFKIFFNV